MMRERRHVHGRIKGLRQWLWDSHRPWKKSITGGTGGGYKKPIAPNEKETCLAASGSIIQQEMRLHKEENYAVELGGKTPPKTYIVQTEEGVEVLLSLLFPLQLPLNTSRFFRRQEEAECLLLARNFAEIAHANGSHIMVLSVACHCKYVVCSGLK